MNLVRGLFALRAFFLFPLALLAFLPFAEFRLLPLAPPPIRPPCTDAPRSFARRTWTALLLAGGARAGKDVDDALEGRVWQRAIELNDERHGRRAGQA